VSTVHQRLRDEHGLAVSLSSLRRYVNANLPEEALRAQVRPPRKTSVRMIDVSQVSLFGNVQVSTQALRECFVREIPVLFFSGGGWLEGIAEGLPSKHVQLRIRQVASAGHGGLPAARAMVRGKIRNCRVLLRRNFDVTEILVHWHAGRSQAEIADSLGVDRKTVRKYTAPAIAAGMRPGGEALEEAGWVALVRSWFPELIDTRLRQSSWPAIEVFHEQIREQMALVTLSTVHQRLRDEHGLAVSLSSLRRYVNANLPEEALRAQVTVLRDDPPPGEEAQVDYGMLGMWWDPARQGLRRVWAFVMVLAASRHLFVRPVLVMDQRAWNDAHVAAFAFFGGVTARVVPGQLEDRGREAGLV